MSEIIQPNYLLYRQIHPSWVSKGRIGTQSFTPFPRDQGGLSVHNGDLITPYKAWRQHTKNYKSMGVLAVSLQECRIIGLKVKPDPKEAPQIETTLLEDEYPSVEDIQDSETFAKAHCLIDFNEFDEDLWKSKGRILLDLALDRNWKYLPVV